MISVCLAFAALSIAPDDTPAPKDPTASTSTTSVYDDPHPGASTRLAFNADLDLGRADQAKILSDLESNAPEPADRLEYFSLYENGGLKRKRWVGVISKTEKVPDGLQLTVRFSPQMTSASIGGLVLTPDTFTETYLLRRGKFTYLRGHGSYSLRGGYASY